MSWQNIFFSWLLRRKAKPLARDLSVSVQAIRDMQARSTWNYKPPRGWRVRATSTLQSWPLCGEWAEPIDAAQQARLKRVILYLHGGGYCFCSPRTHRAIACALASGVQARTLCLDYRLAPEHPFPAAVDDTVAAYRQLVADGTLPADIVIGGDSSGGGLALAALLSLRDAGDCLPAGAVLFSPWADLAATGASLKTNDSSDVMLTGTAVANFSRHYLSGTPADHPIASPLYADLFGLPPLFIQASDSEVLLDDSVRIAGKARAADVNVHFKTWRGLPHAWQTLTPYLPEARAALKEAVTFIHSVTSQALR